MVNFVDDFTSYGATAVLPTPYTAFNIGSIANVALTATVNTAPGVAMLTGFTLEDPDVKARLTCMFRRENFPQDPVMTVTAGFPTIVTMTTPHGVAPGSMGFINLSNVGFGPGPDINGNWVVVFTTPTDFEFQFDSSGGVYAGGDVTDMSMRLDLFARLDKDAVPSAFLPDRGYFARLEYENGGTRNLRLYRIDMDGSGAEILLATSVVTTLTRKDNSSDLSVFQDLRLVVDDDLRDGSTRLRAYFNNLNEESPTLEFIDRGKATATFPGSFPRLAGVTAFRFWAAGILTNRFETYDFAVEDPTAVQIADVNDTLQELQDKIKRRVDRSVSGSSLTDELYQEWINEAQDEIINRLGNMAMFLRIQKRINSQPVDDQLPNSVSRLLLPPEVRLVEEIRSVNTQLPIRWSFAFQDDFGRMVVDVETAEGGPPYEITYFAKTPRLEQLQDRTCIPYEFRSTLVNLCILKAAQYHNDEKLEISAMREYVRTYKILSQSMHRIHRQDRHEKFSGPVGHVSNRYVPAWQRWGAF